MRQTGRLAFARLKVQLNIADIDYAAQIKDCENKI